MMIKLLVKAIGMDYDGYAVALKVFKEIVTSGKQVEQYFRQFLLKGIVSSSLTLASEALEIDFSRPSSTLHPSSNTEVNVLSIVNCNAYPETRRGINLT